eukprot:CAMPEP_0194312274 /NCGR_PEP_ID=MMETSP0171-20130528/9200_1 /TAXON_ID=218684 /ORGANISM="Corethron pennatum, Strain L29A3" /LENGTH=90 /DNA_ID=CAMNT_0039066729 /DNA_START=1376 /DNA_END=1648 /DNA_ORIENTATION=+
MRARRSSSSHNAARPWGVEGLSATDPETLKAMSISVYSVGEYDGFTDGTTVTGETSSKFTSHSVLGPARRNTSFHTRAEAASTTASGGTE